MEFDKIVNIIEIKSKSGLFSEKVILCCGILHIPCVVLIGRHGDKCHVISIRT